MLKKFWNLFISPILAVADACDKYERISENETGVE